MHDEDHARHRRQAHIVGAAGEDVFVETQETGHRRDYSFGILALLDDRRTIS